MWLHPSRGSRLATNMNNTYELLVSAEHQHLNRTNNLQVQFFQTAAFYLTNIGISTLTVKEKKEICSAYL